MAFTINAPKNLLLLPFFILLVIVLAPFAIFFSLVRIPFARRRIRNLASILQQDWLPRKKYIYIGLTGGFKLSDYIKENILPNQSIVWDEWDESQKAWSSSEDDEMGRITIFWQDLGEEFDGEPMIFIATYSPDNFEISRKNGNFHQFTLIHNDDHVLYEGKKLSLLEAQAKVQEITDTALMGWEQKHD